MRQRGIPAFVLAALACLAPNTAHAAPATSKVQFSRQVLPILVKQCGSCHRSSAAPGGYNLDSAEALLQGGRHGVAVTPGKSAEGTLVKYLLGELQPQMPPGKPLALDTIALIRRWIDEGARIDTMVLPTEKGGVMRGAMPMKGSANAGAAALSRSPHAVFLPAAAIQSAPVTALAYSPDGKLLAAGGFRAVRLLDPETGTVVQTLSSPANQVLSLAWSSDGKRLAAAGGLPGAFGEICVWENPEANGAWELLRILKGHEEVIYSLAWRPGTEELATASQDKTARIWDLHTGKVVRVLKDHADVVYAAAYSPDGKWLATASGDRTVKLYDASTYARVASLPHGEAVTALAFSAKSDLLAAASTDRQVRVWPVRMGSIENPLRSHGEGEAVNALAFGADGKTFVWGAINRKVRLWNGEASEQRREFDDVQDWVYAVAVRPDGGQMVAGAADGKTYFWNVNDGKLLRAVSLGRPVVAATPGTKR